MGKTIEEINQETDYIVSFDMRPEDTEVYMKYIAPLPEGSIVVDFGTGQAKNVIRMALCAPQVQIWTWDWARGNPETFPIPYFKIITDRLRKHKVDNVYFSINKSDEAWQDWDQEIDILNIDASHDYHSTLKDLERWEPFVKKGGFIFIHDFEYDKPNFKFTGMRQAVFEYCNKDCQFLEYIGGTQVLCKI